MGAITSTYGRVVSARSKSETSVESDTTEHWSELRVRWSNGNERFGRWQMTADPGDIVIGIWNGNECIGEANASTNQRYPLKAGFNGPLFIISLLLIPVFGIGLFILFLAWTHKNSTTSRWREMTNKEVDRLMSTPEFQTYVRESAGQP